MKNIIDDEFKHFILNAHLKPSLNTSKNLLTNIEEELSPCRRRMTLKLISIQVLLGLITLIIYPQFSHNFVQYDLILTYLNKTVSGDLRTIIQGSIFFFPGSVAAAYILSFSELKRVSSSRLLCFTLQAAICLLLFMLLETNLNLKLYGLWMLGATGGGIILFELNRWIRTFAIAIFR